MNTMKVAIYNGIRKISIEEKLIPKAGPRDVVVQNKRAGICATDTTAYKYDGDIVSIFPGAEFGHEMVGVVSEVGDEVKGIPVGTRVFVNPMLHRTATSTDRGGAFSQFILVENAQIDYNIFVLPDNVSFDEAVITEPFSVGIHGKNIPMAEPSSNVVIFGAGTIGLCALAGLIASGVKKTVVVDIDDHRLELVKELGGVSFNSQSGDINEFLTTHFGQAYSCVGVPTPDVDIFIDCAGAPNIADEFIKLAKFGAKLSIVAVYKKPVEIMLGSLMWSEASIMGSFMYSVTDIKEALSCLSDHSTNINKIITHRFSQSQITEAFEMACDVSKSIKVIIDYDLQ